MAVKIKHPPPKTASLASTTIYISSKTPFVSAKKRVLANLQRIQNKRLGRFLRVMGTGKAITRTLDVAMDLQLSGHRVDLLTKTVKPIDETIDPESVSPETLTRNLSLVELRVYPLKRHEVPGNGSRPLPESEPPKVEDLTA